MAVCACTGMLTVHRRAGDRFGLGGENVNPALTARA
jgi:hypothetical protein